jgi:hypothetical protein
MLDRTASSPLARDARHPPTAFNPFWSVATAFFATRSSSAVSPPISGATPPR